MNEENYIPNKAIVLEWVCGYKHFVRLRIRVKEMGSCTAVENAAALSKNCWIGSHASLTKRG